MRLPSKKEYYPVFNGSRGSKKKRGHPVKYNLQGLYFIKEDGILVYIGMSNYCVIKACYRHFYSWSETRGNRIQRVAYDRFINDRKYEVAIFVLPKGTTVTDAERMFIKKYKPRDNTQYIASLPDKEQRLMDYDPGLNWPVDFVPF